MFRRELGAAQARAGQVAVGEGGDSAEGGGERERLLLRGRVAWRASINVVKAWLGDRVRFLATGGAPTSEAVKAFARSLFHDKAGVSFVDSYGTTESGACVSVFVCIPKHSCKHVYTYTHTYTYTHKYTHTHTCTHMHTYVRRCCPVQRQGLLV
jgi:hypothetical protein